MKYFTMEELVRSETARAKRIDNTPSAEHACHIEESVAALLDPLREEWGVWCLDRRLGTPGIRISSGYRGFRLNEAVRGVVTSAHCYGYAFDMIPMNGRMAEFKLFCRQFVECHPFDQLISESEALDGVPAWMHIGYKDRGGRQRRQLLTMRNGNYLPMT